MQKKTMTGEQTGEETQVPGGALAERVSPHQQAMRLRGAIPRETGPALTIQPANQDGESAVFRGCLWLPPVVWTNKNSDWQGVEWQCDSARLLKTSNSFLSSCQQSNARQAPGDGDEPEESKMMNESCRCIPRCDSTADLPSLGLPSRRFSHPSQEG